MQLSTLKPHVRFQTTLYTHESTTVDPTVASMGLFLLFPSLFASTRMPTTFSRPTSQGAGCLHKAPSPPRRPPRPPGPAIGTPTIRDGRGCGLAQAIRAMERSGLDLRSLTETTRTETCPNNRRGYDVRRAAARPSCAEGAQGGVGVGSQDQLNGRGSESTRFHGKNVVSCEIVQMVSDG